MNHASTDPLLQPYRLKHLTFKNRIMTTSHEPAYAEDGMPKQRYRAYHVERARAGVALTMTAGSAAVSKDSPPVFNNVLAFKDEVVPWMRDLADACHEHGAAVMIQLTHLGRRTRWDKNFWLPVVSPSHRKEAAHRAFPKQIEDWDIERLIKDYADAAERMQAAGLDGIELQAYGHLMDQFWSPLTNTLEGPYGGPLDQRLRFTFDVLTAIRARVGAQFVVGIRYTGDEALDGGLNKQDGLAISRRLKDSGMVDFLNVVRGHIDTDAGLTDLIPIQGMASAPHLDFSGEIRAATQFPTFHAARIQDVATARHAIAAGKVDMVGMTRAHMTDPHIVRKGRELFMPHEIEPARIRRREMLGIIEWRMAQCLGRGVEFRFDTPAEAADVARERPDVVIIATGGSPHTAVLGSGNEWVASAWDVISGAVQLRGDVLLFDDAGDHAGLQAAEFIARGGARLEIMTPDRSFAPEVMAMNLVPYMRSLQALDVTFTVTFRLLSVSQDGGKLRAVVGSDYGGVRRERCVDHVVVNHGTLPNDELYFALKADSRNHGAVDQVRLIAGLAQDTLVNQAGAYQLFRIGDAVAARNTHAAIYDALRLVKDI
jgi:2,4-dienoyl-CoA reductase-like NADH-dependent reductase (Old Yellow Enzyme family)